jgi:hypothetical protein
MGNRSWGFCWKWISRYTGKNRIWTSVHRTWTSLWHLNRSCQGSGQGLVKQKSHKTMGIHNWTQTGKGTTYIRALCQKNKGCVEIKQRPIKMDNRTIYRTLSSKGSLFKLGFTDDPTCERCLEEDELITHILCDCEAVTHFRFRYLCQSFMEPSDFYDAPICKVLHFIRSVGLMKDYSKGKHTRSAIVAVQRSGRGPPLLHTLNT